MGEMATIFWFGMLGFAMLMSGAALVGTNGRSWVGPALIAIGASLVAVALALLAVDVAYAHDNRRPDLIPWFNKLQSRKGPCCDGRDSMHLTVDKWKTLNGHYVVEVPSTSVDYNRAMDGKKDFSTTWVSVPDEAVVTVPNLDGATMVWPFYGSEGVVSIRCFMPGTLT